MLHSIEAVLIYTPINSIGECPFACMLANIRDNIDAIKALHTKNSVSDFNTDSRDYIGFATEGTLVSFAVLKRHSELVTLVISEEWDYFVILLSFLNLSILSEIFSMQGTALLKEDV